MPKPSQILRARFIAPLDQPILENGAIAIRDGRIVDVDRAPKILSQNSDASITDFGDSIILPGLVNAHVHLELSTLRARAQPRGSFAEWLLARVKAPMSAPIDCSAATKLGIEQSLAFGVTTVGDITQQHIASRTVLASSRINGISFGEVLGVGARRPRFEQLLKTALNPIDHINIGLSPHAPYSVDLASFRECVNLARDRQIPIATHLAESPDEEQFLKSHTGPFRELLEALGSWRDDIETFSGSPIEMAAAIGLLDLPRSLLAHVNYCNDAELELLARGKASVVYCPRTHAYFGHPPHRWREMLARGINIAIGTDSCASSPDLNLLDDLRLLRTLAPDMPGELLWKIATINAANALGLSSEAGSIAPGKRANLIVFAANGRGDPLARLLDEPALNPAVVYLNGNEHQPRPPTESEC